MIYLFIITLHCLIKMSSFLALGWDYINPLSCFYLSVSGGLITGS